MNGGSFALWCNCGWAAPGGSGAGGGVVLALGRFHDDVCREFGGLPGAEGAGVLLFGRTEFEAVMEDAAAGGVVDIAEGVVQFLGDLAAEFRGFAGAAGTAEKVASRHDGAGERAAGTACTAHAAAEAACGLQEAEGAFLATAGEKGHEDGFGTVEVKFTVGVFGGLGGKFGILFCEYHSVSILLG